MEKSFTIDEGKGNMQVKKVLKRNDGIKYIIIPKDSGFNEGDFIILKKLKEV